MEPITYELKYCERCGALRLRRSHSGEIYCAPCEQVLNNYVFPGSRGRGNGKPILLAPALVEMATSAGRTA